MHSEQILGINQRYVVRFSIVALDLIHLSFSVRSVHACARIGVPSLAWVLDYWVLAPLHILPYTHSSLHSACVRSHVCACLGSELLDLSFITHATLQVGHR